MPNHFHGIIEIGAVGAGLAPAPNNVAPAPNNNTPNPNDNRAGANNNGAGANNNGAGANNNRAGASPAPTVGQMVGAFKSLVMKKCLEIAKSRNEYLGKLWQRNYFEHIIRDWQSYQTIADYIISNPDKWQDDTFYTPQKIQQ
ncbi:MAG: hypothetical protein LBE18_05095 [Planctomycetaceae bacterium]|nr:hypothetical protein [Planctomycetaceae bacterium]